MKKITLLVTAIFLMGNAANAFNRGPINIADAEPVVFIERGIEFYVFADGQIDFNTRPAASTTYMYRSGRRNVNNTYGAPGVSNSNYGVVVQHDDYGRVRRIGNVFLNYDSHNRIKRIGSVYMSYNRFALAQVGGLRINYNHRGQIVGYHGNVNGRRTEIVNQYSPYNQGYTYGPVNNDDIYYRQAIPKK